MGALSARADSPIPLFPVPRRARHVATYVQSKPKGRLKRVLQLMRALQSGPPSTPDELALRFGVSRRTVFRDLELLTEAGISNTYNRSTGTYSMRLD